MSWIGWVIFIAITAFLMFVVAVLLKLFVASRIPIVNATPFFVLWVLLIIGAAMAQAAGLPVAAAYAALLDWMKKMLTGMEVLLCASATL